MSLRFNSFRNQRYLRSRFVQGRFLLAAEASNIELEILDLLREETKKKIGNNVAFGEAFKVEKVTDTQLLIKPGEAWFEGLPFDLRSSSDQLFKVGQLPVGVTLESDSAGKGKLLNFNDSTTTPTNNYKIVLTAQEELITSAEDPFLKNANIAEPTGQKIRLVVQVNVVPKELQTDKPVPYTDQNSTSANTTNYPDTGNSAAPNLGNKVIVTPESGRNGELEATSAISSSKEIDGRDLEITITNDPNGLANVRGQVQSFTSTTITVQSGSEFNSDGGDIDVNGDQFSYTSYDKSTGQFSGVSPDPTGSISTSEDVSPVGVPIPTGSNARDAFSNGTLIDSNGTEYHINLIENDNTNTKSIIRIDKEVGQDDPVITNGKPYTLEKRPVYATDDVNGSPQGKLHWPISDIEFDSSDGFVHNSSIQDLRKVVNTAVDFQEKTNQKFDVKLTEGGNVSWNSPNLAWASDFTVVNPYGPNQTISSATIPMPDNTSLVYQMDLENGGAIDKGDLSVNISSGGTTVTLSSVNLEDVSVGNIIQDSGNTVAEILEIDNVNNTLVVDTSLTTGSATIYKDAFSNEKAPLTENSFALAVREGSKVYVGAALELEDGETSQVGDGISTQLLQFLGSGVTETTDSPTYSSDIRGTAGEALQERIGVLTAAEGDNQEDRSAFLRSDERITWEGSQLEFSSDLVLEILNTKDGTKTEHTVASSNSPISIANGESIWVSIDRTQTSETLTVNNSGTTPIPAQTQANKDVFVLFKRIDATGGDRLLYLPFAKQVLNEGQVVRLGASGSGGGGGIRADLHDDSSTTLPSGASATIDGVSVSNGDQVLFTNLSSNNNKIYEVSGVGSSLTWTPVKAFSDNTETPSDAESVRIKRGTVYSEELIIYDGTEFFVNDVIKKFDDTDFSEEEYLHSISLTGGATGTVASELTFAHSDFEGVFIDYKVKDDSNSSVRIGQLTVATNGSSVDIVDTYNETSDVGVEWNASINGSNVELDYTTTTNSKTMRALVRRIKV